MMNHPSSGEPQGSAGTGISEEQSSRSTPFPKGPAALFLVWNRIAPFFISAALFLSGFFALFSPLPFLIMGMTMPWGWLLAAIATNSAIVYFTSGPTVFQFYLLAVGLIGLVLPFFIRRRLSPESIVARTFIVQWATVGALVGVYAVIHHTTLGMELSGIFSHFFDSLLASLSPESREQLLSNFGGGDLGVEEWRRKTLAELPGAIGILCILLIWFSLRVLVNLNPGRFASGLGLDRARLNQWKNAEWLIWPTIASWAVVLFSEGVPSEIGLNIFKICMAAYGLQGLSVMGSAFDAYRVQSFVRILIYSLVILLLMPLLLSIGFFDQWFDFRSKFRQT
ncbi:MAG: DUF2232 domain-containing protein [Cryobacterium sp.]|nr:DUF2232 domain-containing protein [Oligoflexia bacterium]